MPSEYSPEKVADGGLVQRQRQPDLYEVEGRKRSWWEEAEGYSEIDIVYTVLDCAGVEYVRGREREMLDPGLAFEEDELETVEDIAKHLYPDEKVGATEIFRKDVEDSDLHPQQSKQIARYIEEEDTNFPPTEFSEWDGLPGYWGRE